MKKIVSSQNFWLIIILLLGAAYSRKPHINHNRSITSDGKGYYAFLPAAFIYHDFDFNFFRNYEYKHYSDFVKDHRIFTVDINGNTINKYFTGISVLLLPFFLLAHALALMFDLEADGYSNIYQYAVLIASLFYSSLALFFIDRAFKKLQFSTKAILLSKIFLLFGSNFLQSAYNEPSMAHVYGFFMSTVIFERALSYFETKKMSVLFVLFLSLGLSFAMRPTNLLMSFFIVLAAGSFSEFWKNTVAIAFNYKAILTCIGGFLIFGLLNYIYWFYETGSPFVDTYMGEKLDLLHPHFFDYMFSSERGIFIHQPLMLIGLVGYLNFRTNEKNRKLLGLFFSFLIIYILSSWWCWHFLSRFGNRSITDFLLLFALGIAYLVDNYKGIKSNTLAIVILLLSSYNLFYLWQHNKAIIPGTYLSFSEMPKYFFKTLPLAESNINPDKIIKIETYEHNMETNLGWSNEHGLNSEMAFESKQSCKIDSNNQFGILRNFNLPRFSLKDSILIRMSANFHTNASDSETRFVFQFYKNGKNARYDARFIKHFVSPNKWHKVELEFRYTEEFDADSVTVYVWNPGKDEITYYDNLKYEVVYCENLVEDE